MLRQTDPENKAIPKHKLSNSSMTKFPSIILTTTKVSKANLTTTKIEIIGIETAGTKMKLNNKMTLRRSFSLLPAKKNNQTLSGNSKEVSTVIRLNWAKSTVKVKL